MSDFVELDLPVQTNNGKKYYVPTSASEELGMALLRNDYMGIDYYNDNYYLFNTRAQAHEAAARYYDDHRRVYPHEKDYEYTLLHETPQSEWGINRVVESQVMEFI